MTWADFLITGQGPIGCHTLVILVCWAGPVAGVVIGKIAGAGPIVVDLESISFSPTHEGVQCPSVSHVSLTFKFKTTSFL